jgi:hypothetical protein
VNRLKDIEFGEVNLQKIKETGKERMKKKNIKSESSRIGEFARNEKKLD